MTAFRYFVLYRSIVPQPLYNGVILQLATVGQHVHVHYLVGLGVLVLLHDSTMSGTYTPTMCFNDRGVGGIHEG